MKLTRNTLIEGKIVEAGTTILIEKKDHLIKKMNQLTDKQKQELIDYFNKHPNFENKLDWNKAGKYTWDEITDLLGFQKGTQGLKKGIKGLKAVTQELVEGTDYFEIALPESRLEGTVVNAYIPLNHETSKLIASDSIGGCRGKWCTARQDSSHYWYVYTRKGIVLVYIIVNSSEGNPEKYAIAYSMYGMEAEIFDMADRSISSRVVEIQTGIDFEEFLPIGLLKKAHTILEAQDTPLSKLRKIALGEITSETLEDNQDLFYTSPFLKIKGNNVFYDIDEHNFHQGNKYVLETFVFTHDYEFVESNIGYISNNDIFQMFIDLDLSKVEKDINEFLYENDFDGTIDDVREHPDFQDKYPDIYDAFVRVYMTAYDSEYSNHFHKMVIETVKDAVSEIGEVDKSTIGESSWTVKLDTSIVADAIDDAIEYVVDIEEYIEKKGYLNEKLEFDEDRIYVSDSDIEEILPELTDMLDI